MSDEQGSKTPRSRLERASQPAPAAATKPAGAPGKRTRTMSLPPRSAGAAFPVQQKANPAADAARQERAELTGRWIDTTIRPDLYPPPVQRKSANDTAQPASDFHHLATNGISGAATTLPHLDRIQRSFGSHDASGIEAHVGGPAAESSRAIGAEAYATGNHVAFRSSPDLHLAAHEAAHVIQQRQGVQLAGGMGRTGDAYERNADAVADAVVAGRSAQALLDSASPGPASGPTVQKRDEEPAAGNATPGHSESTPYGEYWVIPDGTQVSRLNTGKPSITGEVITETEFAALTAAWTSIRAGAENIRITETGRDGTEYAGFRARVIAHFGSLLSRPVGRRLVMGLLEGSNTVTIVPGPPGMVAGAARGQGSLENADGTAGAGGDSTIILEAGLTDTDMVCFDRDGNEIGAPVFTILGHELIHARHNAAGRNRRQSPSTDAAYSNLEEEETVASGDLTENMIRAEHGIEGTRHGSGGRDTRQGG